MLMSVVSIWLYHGQASWLTGLSMRDHHGSLKPSAA